MSTEENSGDVVSPTITAAQGNPPLLTSTAPNSPKEVSSKVDKNLAAVYVGRNRNSVITRGVLAKSMATSRPISKQPPQNDLTEVMGSSNENNIFNLPAEEDQLIVDPSKVLTIHVKKNSMLAATLIDHAKGVTNGWQQEGRRPRQQSQSIDYQSFLVNSADTTTVTQNIKKASVANRLVNTSNVKQRSNAGVVGRPPVQGRLRSQNYHIQHQQKHRHQKQFQTETHQGINLNTSDCSDGLQSPLSVHGKLQKLQQHQQLCVVPQFRSSQQNGLIVGRGGVGHVDKSYPVRMHLPKVGTLSRTLQNGGQVIKKEASKGSTDLVQTRLMVHQKDYGASTTTMVQDIQFGGQGIQNYHPSDGINTLKHQQCSPKSTKMSRTNFSGNSRQHRMKQCPTLKVKIQNEKQNFTSYVEQQSPVPLNLDIIDSRESISISRIEEPRYSIGVDSQQTHAFSNTNPFNVLSFKTAGQRSPADKSDIVSPELAGIPRNGVNLINHLTIQGDRNCNNSIDGQTAQLRYQVRKRKQPQGSPIDQVIRAPRLANIEALKRRPKTNRLEMSFQSVETYDDGRPFNLNQGSSQETAAPQGQLVNVKVVPTVFPVSSTDMHGGGTKHLFASQQLKNTVKTIVPGLRKGLSKAQQKQRKEALNNLKIEQTEMGKTTSTMRQSANQQPFSSKPITSANNTTKNHSKPMVQKDYGTDAFKTGPSSRSNDLQAQLSNALRQRLKNLKQDAVSGKDMRKSIVWGNKKRSVDSSDLMVNGSRAGSPQLYVTGSYDTCGALRNMRLAPLGISAINQSATFKNNSFAEIAEDQIPIMSNDTSRSPIPIDAETFKTMNMFLPDLSRFNSNPSNENSPLAQSNVSLQQQEAQLQIKSFLMSTKKKKKVPKAHTNRKTIKIDNKEPSPKNGGSNHLDSGRSTTRRNQDIETDLRHSQQPPEEDSNPQTRVGSRERKNQTLLIGGTAAANSHAKRGVGKQNTQHEFTTLQEEEYENIPGLRPATQGITTVVSAEVPNEVAIHVNNFNINITEEQKTVDDSNPYANAIAAKRPVSRAASNDTDYNKPSSVTPVPPGNTKLIDPATMQPTIKIFQPVLKTKSYRHKNNSSSNNFQTGQTVTNSSIISSEHQRRIQEEEELDFEANLGIRSPILVTSHSQIANNEESKVIQAEEEDAYVQAKMNFVIQSQENIFSAVNNYSAENSTCSANQSKSNMVGPSLNQMHMQANYEHEDSLGTTDEDQNISDCSSDSVNTELVRRQLRMDSMALGLCEREGNGVQDFVACKAGEFLKIQTRLCQMDHNTLKSEKDQNMDIRVDLFMKGVALQSPKKQASSKMDASTFGVSSRGANDSAAGGGGENVFNLAQLRTLHIKSEVPTQMIQFKNKSQKTRFVRIAKTIAKFHDSVQQGKQTNPVDINLTFMRIFRFLANSLTEQEFDSLSYYHVSTFIKAMLKFMSEDTYMILEQPVSLQQFVCDTLDLRYQSSHLSQKTLTTDQFKLSTQKLGQIGGNTATQQKTSWTMPQSAADEKVDLYQTFNGHEFNSGPSRQLTGNAETRHNQINQKIYSQIKSFAFEPTLPSAFNASFKGKETIKRGNLARLLKSNKQINDLDYYSLSQESTIARNQVMLEHVVATRNMRDWRDQVLSELHDEARKDTTTTPKDCSENQT